MTFGLLREWAAAIFVLAWVLLTPPVLGIFAEPELIGGVPRIYVFVFVAWLGVIALVGGLLRRYPDTAADVDTRDRQL